VFVDTDIVIAGGKSVLHIQPGLDLENRLCAISRGADIRGAENTLVLDSYHFWQ
jgi:hypothetical protein